MADDSTISQFLSFAGSGADASTARQYLEMSGNNLETAVGLFMDHGSGGAGGAGGLGGGGDAGGAAPFGFGPGQGPEVRAPDATRREALVGGYRPGPRAAGAMGTALTNAGDEPPAALVAALGGPAAREMMRNAALAAAQGSLGGGLGGGGLGEGLGGGGAFADMASTWAAADPGAAVMPGGTGNLTRAGGGSGGRNARRNASRRGDDDDSDGEEDLGAVEADTQAMDEDDDYDDDEDDDGHDLGGTDGSRRPNGNAGPRQPSLSTMFAPPAHLMHRAGGFMGARNFAKDARRWLLVNVQSDDDFACHALNRDVWRDELVENLVREGFILWQAMSNSNEGQTYITRYKVTGYPHLAIIDPRTGSLLWRKEGWTQVNPLTAEQFVEIASDFCSRHSFDRLPTAARHAYAGGVPLGAAVTESHTNGDGGRPAAANGNNKRPIHELTEEEQLQAAIQASMQEDGDAGDEGDTEADGKPTATEAVTVSNNDDATPSKNVAIDEDESKQSAFEREILSMDVGDEPTAGDVARVQIRMPDGKRLVRKFGGGSPVKVIYAFVAQRREGAGEAGPSGRAFELKAKFPPQDLFASIDDSISGCGLNGEAINVIWK